MTSSSTYFILTTSSITQSQKDECVGEFENQRQNDDTTKTILEVYCWNKNNSESAFFGVTPHELEEIQFEITKAEWQGA